jgi:uncharacterized membrane protein (DUF4010 family)
VTTTAFPPLDVAVRILVAVGCGLLVGLERQWAHKELGGRTFTIVSLLGALIALVSQSFMVAGLVGVIVLIGLSSLGNLTQERQVETTTAAALLAAYILGALAGQGHVFTPAAAAILMTLVLSLKPQLTRFTVGLSQEELRSATLLALIAFVIYPVLPNRFIDPWKIFNPREAWLVIVLVSAIGFVNYVLLRLHGARGLYYSAIFGGLVNSTAAIAELSSLLRTAGDDAEAMAPVVNQLTVVAMFVRNLALLAVFSTAAGMVAAWPIGAMAAVSAVYVFGRWRRIDASGSIQLGSPVELRKVTSFGLLFLIIQLASAIAQKLLGSSAVIAVSALGGLASSASSTAAVALLASHKSIAPREAAIATLTASITSMLVNLPIVYGQLKDKRLIRTQIALSGGVAVVGGGVMAMMSVF